MEPDCWWKACTWRRYEYENMVFWRWKRSRWQMMEPEGRKSNHGCFLWRNHSAETYISDVAPFFLAVKCEVRSQISDRSDSSIQVPHHLNTHPDGFWSKYFAMTKILSKIIANQMHLGNGSLVMISICKLQRGCLSYAPHLACPLPSKEEHENINTLNFDLPL